MRTVIGTFSLICSLSLLSGCASQVPATKDELNHEFILNFPGKTKAQMFDKTSKWIANSFRSAKSVIEYQDKESGSIVGNGNTEIKVEGALIGSTLGFTMNVDIRDERMRVRFVNLKFIFGNSEGSWPETGAAQRPAQQKFAELVNSLSDFVNKNDEF